MAVPRYRYSNHSEAIALTIITGIFVLGMAVLWMGSSYFEARAYERVTGQHVSTWDAMFLDLRVMSTPQ
jgi:hypothetical protein